MICAAIASSATTSKASTSAELASGDVIAGFCADRTRSRIRRGARSRARARRDGDGYVLNGRKQWCTNGGYAGVMMGMFRTGGPGTKGITAFLIETALPGSSSRRSPRSSASTRAIPSISRSTTCACRRGAARRRRRRVHDGAGGADRRPDRHRRASRRHPRGVLSMRRSQFAKERVAFGKPIGAFEGVSFKIAQMATDLDAARLLVYRAAALADAGMPFAIEASKAKLFASTAARKHAAEAVQIHGGYGYTTEFPVERYYRDAKITEIYEGTSEIQQIIIARSLLGEVAYRTALI